MYCFKLANFTRIWTNLALNLTEFAKNLTTFAWNLTTFA